YDRLFTKADPAEDKDIDYKTYLNPHSLETLTACKLEPGLAQARDGDRFQFERQGYFCVDRDSNEERLVFNRTVSLRDSWAKIEKQNHS
ncbi:MAG: glutamine--tRNA ligase, partial [bacterium]